MRHIWTTLSEEGGPYSYPKGCTGCGTRLELRRRESRKARTPGQMVSVEVYILPGGEETERLPDCDRALLIPKTPAARPTPVQELAELRIRFEQVKKDAEERFSRDVRVREILGADLSETTEAAAERAVAGRVRYDAVERVAGALAGGAR